MTAPVDRGSEGINVALLARAVTLTGVYLDITEGFELPNPAEFATMIAREYDELIAPHFLRPECSRCDHAKYHHGHTDGRSGKWVDDGRCFVNGCKCRGSFKDIDLTSLIDQDFDE